MTDHGNSFLVITVCPTLLGTKCGRGLHSMFSPFIRVGKVNVYLNRPYTVHNTNISWKCFKFSISMGGNYVFFFFSFINAFVCSVAVNRCKSDSFNMLMRHTQDIITWAFSSDSLTHDGGTDGRISPKLSSDSYFIPESKDKNKKLHFA